MPRVRSAAGAAALAVANARPAPFAVARPLAGPDAAVCARSVAVGPFDRVLDGAFAIAIVGRDCFNRRDDDLRGCRLGSRFRRRRLNDWLNRCRLRCVLLARRRHHRLLADARNRNLQARLAAARDFRRRTWLAQTAAAAAPAGSRAEEEDEVCFLVHRILHGRGLGAIHGQHDEEQRHRGVCDERQHDRLACLAPRAGRLEQLRRRLRMQRERRLAQAPGRARRVRDVNERRVGNEAQVAAAEERADGVRRHARRASDFVDREDFGERTLGH